VAEPPERPGDPFHIQGKPRIHRPGDHTHPRCRRASAGTAYEQWLLVASMFRLWRHNVAELREERRQQRQEVRVCVCACACVQASANSGGRDRRRKSV
jgi:hypothetical protein